MFIGGIQRPDPRPPEVKAAADKIKIGYLAFPGGGAVFRCSECGQTDWLPHNIEHSIECSVGKVMAEWQKTLPWWMQKK